jgi:ribonuclease VapC
MSERRYVLDASALLCLFYGEPGSDRVEAVLDRAVMAAVNFAEVVAKLADRGVLDDAMARDLAELDLEVVADDRQLATEAGRIGAGPDRSGLAVGDRFCLALAKQKGAVALTCDRSWTRIGAAIGVAVEVVDGDAR